MENSDSMKSPNEKSPSSERGTRIEALVVKLLRFYSVMGNKPDEPGALALLAEILCQSATDTQIALAMTRCTHECRYPVRLGDFLQRIPGQEVPAPEAEARKAWGVLEAFVRKYVGNDCCGNYGPEHGWHPKTFPKLADRILDTVRCTGSWSIYKRMTDEDFPFVQKRFLEEYAAWTAVERVDVAHMITAAVAAVKQLPAPATPMGAPNATKPPAALFIVKPIPQALTPAQMRDRLEMLKQQQAEILRRWGKEMPSAM